eukprot:SAG31_NODE_19584_length_597_cov_4.399598_1_plen_26_part_01
MGTDKHTARRHSTPQSVKPQSINAIN